MRQLLHWDLEEVSWKLENWKHICTSEGSCHDENVNENGEVRENYIWYVYLICVVYIKSVKFKLNYISQFFR